MKREKAQEEGERKTKREAQRNKHHKCAENEKKRWRDVLQIFVQDFLPSILKHYRDTMAMHGYVGAACVMNNFCNSHTKKKNFISAFVHLLVGV